MFPAIRGRKWDHDVVNSAMVRRIDRTSPLPFYFQLKQILLGHIQSQSLKPGDRLPGDFALCETYGVSRTVVRQALTELEVEGVITRSKGRGTFVAEYPTGQGLIASLTGLHEDTAARGLTMRSDVKKIVVAPADAAIASLLRIRLGDPVVHIERLRLVEGEPWVYAVTDVPHAIAPGLEDEDLAEQSLYALMEQKYGVTIVRGRRVVEADLAGSRLARLLGVRRSDPLLVLRSVSVDADNVPVERFTAYHRADRSRFEVELERDAIGPRPQMVMTDRL